MVDRLALLPTRAMHDGGIILPYSSPVLIALFGQPLHFGLTVNRLINDCKLRSHLSIMWLECHHLCSTVVVFFTTFRQTCKTSWHFPRAELSVFSKSSRAWVLYRGYTPRVGENFSNYWNTSMCRSLRSIANTTG